MVYYTGDTHGNFDKIEDFISDNNLTKDDTIVILGDAGFNYYGNSRDRLAKKWVSEYGITIFCIHGNHEMRPQTINTYKQKLWNCGAVYYEEEFPNILFAPDGSLYELDGQKTLVIGGAYSVDKEYRLARGWNWFPDEQPTEETKQCVKNWIERCHEVDQVLTHTCPLKYVPTEAFIPGIDQSKVDRSTEEFLDEVEDKLNYSRWLCGHWHIDKSIDKIRFIMDDFIT